MRHGGDLLHFWQERERIELFESDERVFKHTFQFERPAIVVVKRYGRTQVDTDVKSLTCCKGGRNRPGHVRADDAQHDLGRAAQIGNVRVTLDLVFFRRQ